ncbi:MAG: hypothetical protein AAF702_40550 [Chloroflexota bacterium]
MKQVTLVSLYGQKTGLVAQLIRDCCHMIEKSPLRRVFRAYHPSQMHGTIVGMEKLIGYSAPFNTNIWSAIGEKVMMGFDQVLPTLQQHFPMTIQFGGFSPFFNQFDSFGNLPYERSFQVQWPTNRFTLIGWPHANGNFTTTRLLNCLRDDLNVQCNVAHKYSGDNDLFIVLGKIVHLERFTDAEIEQLQEAAKTLEVQIRNHLAATKTGVTIELDDISLVQYEMETLPLHSTISHRVTDPGVTPEFISNLYG